MGAIMTGILEWTHTAQFHFNFPESRVVGDDAPTWKDDYIHGILFETDKEYDFFAAISGARSRFQKEPLIAARGVPAHLSGPARELFGNTGGALAGWLHLSEIDACVRHISVEPLEFGVEVEIAMEIMKMLVGRFGDLHVRMVFNIESA